jgi:Type II intron maturase
MIKDRLAVFLRDELKLELSAEKTPITHARTRAARYLGHEIVVQHADSKITNGRRSVNGTIGLRVPLDVIKAKCAPDLRHGKPCHRSAMQNLDDFDLVKIYGAEYRGLVQYHLPAIDVWRLDRLCWNAQVSMLKTLAAKHQSTAIKMAAKHKATIETPHGPRACYEARIERPGKEALVARFGGIPLVRNRRAVLVDRSSSHQVIYPRKELVRRLLTRRCELCGEPGAVTVHQVRNLASLGMHTGQPPWAALMLKKRRETLVVCRSCQDVVHGGKPIAQSA